jgi:uncharacterized protein involved in exopolysaccharide biosynthesis
MARQSTYRADFVESEESAISPPNYEESPMLLLSLLSILMRSRRTLLAFTSAGLIIAVIIAVLLPVHYTSTASFLPPGANSSSGAAMLAGQLSQLSGLGGGASLLGAAKTPADLYTGILKSRSIAGELVKRFDLQHVYKVEKESRAEKLLAAHSTFDVGLKDSIITVAVTDASPTRARDMANAYIDALRETNSRLALSEASQRRLFFGQQLAKEKDALADAEVDLKRTEEQSGLIAPAGQTASEIQTIAQTRAEISVRQVELSALRQSATDQNPEVIRLRSEIADLQGQLARMHSGSGQGAGTAIPTSKVPALALEYIRKEREVKYHEALFEMLARQYESARLDEAHEAPLLQILDPADYPDSRSGPPRMLIALGGLLLGLLAGCARVLLRDRLSGSS